MIFDRFLTDLGMIFDDFLKMLLAFSYYLCICVWLLGISFKRTVAGRP